MLETLVVFLAFFVEKMSSPCDDFGFQVYASFLFLFISSLHVRSALTFVRVLRPLNIIFFIVKSNVQSYCKDCFCVFDTFCCRLIRALRGRHFTMQSLCAPAFLYRIWWSVCVRYSKLSRQQCLWVDGRGKQKCNL